MPIPMGRPWGGSLIIKKNSFPAVPWKGPETGVLRRDHDFNGLGVKLQVHTRFSRAKKGGIQERTVTR